MSSPSPPSPPSPAIWGRRPYADKAARELLNDLSARIARAQPDDIDDPGNPSLGDVIAFAIRQDGRDILAQKVQTLTDLMRHDLTFQEAMYWYWFRYGNLDLVEIHYAQEGYNKAGDPVQRRNSVRNIRKVLESAAAKIPDADPSDVPDLDWSN